MKNMKRNGRLGLAFIAAIVVVAMTPAAFAQGTSTIEIHGFGGWAYGETNGLSYTLGDSDGIAENAEFALNFSVQPTDRLSFVAQGFFESDHHGQNAEIDYAFAEWKFNDAAKVRIGRVKHAFGIYGEIFDVGTLRW